MKGALTKRLLFGSCVCFFLSHCQAEAACMLTPTPRKTNQAEDLKKLLKQARERDGRYQPPPLGELPKVYQAGVALLSEVTTGRAGNATTLFQDVHLVLCSTQLGGAAALAVREAPLHRRGSGVFVFRIGALPKEWLVQVPHSFSDVGTLTIGIELASALRARALFVNTVHRYHGQRSLGGEDEQRSDVSLEAPADLAHQELTYFQQLTLAALATFPRLSVLQVHGFADGSVPEHPGAAVVLSPGSARAGAQEAARLAARLGGLLGKDRVLLYPRDTHKLGAQTNMQGRAVAAAPQSVFLHLELSRTLREALLKDAALRRTFAAVVAGQGPIAP